VLYSVDGVVYALVGKELTRKPLAQWVMMTWNGAPFYEHPHLTPWLLGASMKLLGASTLAAILPIVLMALATVLLAYLLGRDLLDHRLGLLAGTVITLTPEFVRGGRNPMLEPALMFFIMLAVYFHVVVTRPGRFLRNTILSGVSLGLALLAKGPPAVLALVVIIAFQSAAHAWPDTFKGFMLPRGRLLTHLLAIVLIATAIVTLMDLWQGVGRHLICRALRQPPTAIHDRRWPMRPQTVGRTDLNTFVRDWPGGRSWLLASCWWPGNEIMKRYPPSCSAGR
jgi:4-amino-4-deoxy-L-arabinose transferase-like glycosyltransferase